MLNRFRKSLAVFALIAILGPTVVFEARAGELEVIQAKVAQYLKRPGIRSALWGIQFLDPSADKVLVEVNPDKTFMPASVLKVVTTSAALEKLGPDFKYHTDVYTDGTIAEDGCVSGDLILVGRGDPNLMDPYGELFQKPALQELAEKLQQAGIKEINGDVIGDDSYFDHRSRGNGWSDYDLRTIYGAPVNALSINNNVFWVYARPTKLRNKVSVSIEPETSYFRIRNLGTTVGRRSRSSLSVRLIPGTKTIVVSGGLRANQVHSQYILLEKPSEVTATMFKEALERHGIAIRGTVRTFHKGDYSEEEREGWKMLAGHESPPLYRALQIINKRSQNLHAEMLLRTLGAEFKGEGSDDAGLQVVKEFLIEAGIDSDKIHLNDGCGLSRENLITPRFQTSLLQFLSKRPYFDLFLNSLAISGTDGTLRNRLSGAEVKGSIHAKTGTLNGVTTLSGYLTTKSGRNLVFSIFANRVNYEARVKKTIDAICALFVNLY